MTDKPVERAGPMYKQQKIKEIILKKNLNYAQKLEK